MNCDWINVGLPVKGYEIDAGWWESKYCPPKFWPHIECVNVDSLPDIGGDDALLFCYFNNIGAFGRYLDKFKGSCIVLIGPDEGNRRHCDPSPFHLRNDANWDVHSVHCNAFNDAIVVYKRVVSWRSQHQLPPILELVDFSVIVNPVIFHLMPFRF